MPTLFISDLHLAPQRPRIGQLFLDFLATRAAHADALYILGDLFDYWIGDDGADLTGHRDTLTALRSTGDSGVPIYFMRGNRDFLVGERFARDTGVEVLDDPAVITLNGRRVLLSHGDRLCTDDVEHQRFRDMVDDPAWRADFLAHPLEERLRLARAARSQSEHNKTVNAMEIMDVNGAAVACALNDHAAAVIIHGHTHRPAVHQIEVAGGSAQRIVLGDWYEHSSVLCVEPGGDFKLSAGREVLPGTTAG